MSPMGGDVLPGPLGTCEQADPNGGKKQAAAADEAGPRGPRDDLQERYSSVQAADEVTTLMIRNVPRRYSEETLTKELQAYISQDLYNFLYLPWDSRRSSNVGYAFINLLDSATALLLRERLDGQPWRLVDTPKTAKIVPAHMQGLALNLAHYVGSTVTDEGHAHRPMVSRNGKPIGFQEAVDRYCPPELLRALHKDGRPLSAPEPLDSKENTRGFDAKLPPATAQTCANACFQDNTHGFDAKLAPATAQTCANACSQDNTRGFDAKLPPATAQTCANVCFQDAKPQAWAARLPAAAPPQDLVGMNGVQPMKPACDLSYRSDVSTTFYPSEGSMPDSSTVQAAQCDYSLRSSQAYYHSWQNLSMQVEALLAAQQHQFQ